MAVPREELKGIDAYFWMNLQAQYGLEIEEREANKKIAAEVTLLQRAS